MSFARLLPFMMVAVFGCRLENPAFEDGEEAAGTDDIVGDDSSAGESGTSLGESTSEEDSSETVSESTSQSSSSESSSEGVDTSEGVMESSSEGIDTSSEGVMESSSESGMTSSSEGIMESSTDGLDAPDLSCPQVFPADDCFSCMQNNCCTEFDTGCFDGVDPKCNCVLLCLAQGGLNCGEDCSADVNQAGHAQELYQCGLMLCANLCG